MSIVIKEIHVKTTVENRASEVAFSKEAIAALKRSIIKELTNVEYTRRKQFIKDR